MEIENKILPLVPRQETRDLKRILTSDEGICTQKKKKKKRTTMRSIESRRWRSCSKLYENIYRLSDRIDDGKGYAANPGHPVCRTIIYKDRTMARAARNSSVVHHASPAYQRAPFLAPLRAQPAIMFSRAGEGRGQEGRRRSSRRSVFSRLAPL